MKDMCVFEADWKLQADISAFSAAEGDNIAYIAGGVSKDIYSGKLVETNKVFSVTFKKPSTSKKT